MKNLMFISAAVMALAFCPRAEGQTYFSGNGGKGMSLAVLAPESKGIAADYLPALTQGVFVADMKKYSAIDVLDRLNLEKVLKETESGIYTGGDGFMELGAVAKVGYVMTGSITKTSSGYALQMQITDTKTGKTKAAYSGSCSIAEFENHTGIKRASLDLLTQMGVNLNSRAKAELSGADSEQSINAQRALAQGITADKRGATIVEVMQYYYQAVDYDAKLTEAAGNLAAVNNRLTTLSQRSAAAKTGNIREDALNEIAAYRIEEENKRIDDANKQAWIKQLTDCENYFAGFFKTANAPLELAYTTVEREGLDKANEMITLQFFAGLQGTKKSWFTAAEQTIGAVRKALVKTGRAQAWGLANWPAESVSASTPFTEVRKNYTITAELLDEKGVKLGTASFSLTGGWNCTIYESLGTISFSAFAESWYLKPVVFAPINVRRVTDTLSIKIISVNNIDAAAAAQNGILAITKYKETYSVMPLIMELGYVYKPEYPVGIRVGILGLYTTWSFLETTVRKKIDSGGAPDYIYELNNRYEEVKAYKIEGLLGFSINLIDGIAMLPIGFGADMTSYEKGGMEFDGFVCEAGLAVNPVKWLSVVATYRLINFTENSFSIGCCFTNFMNRKTGKWDW